LEKDLENIYCKNCSTLLSGSFCSECGQKYIDKRFTLKDSISSIFYAVFNTDHGFIYTSKSLILSPSSVIKDFLNGITIRYIHPFRFLLIWATINTLLVIGLGTFDEQTQMLNESLNYSQEQIEMNQKVQEYIKKYLSFVILLNVPFISLFTWLFYRKTKYNYAEHLVINAYGYALVSIFGIVSIGVEVLIGDPAFSMGISILLNLGLMAYVLMQTFKENYFLSLIKFLVSFIMSYVVAIMLITILMIGILILKKVLA
jgi:hypothetical protein